MGGIKKGLSKSTFKFRRGSVWTCIQVLLVFLLFLLIFTPLRIFSPSKAPEDVPITLVIPATFEDYRCYVQHFYQKVIEGSVLPKEIIIVVSGVPAGYHETAPIIVQDLDVVVEIVFESRPHNQAMNKNTGASMATGDLILFFDVDDALHPWGLHAVKEAYKLNSHYIDLSGIIFSHDHLQERQKASFSKSKKVPTCTISEVGGCNKLAKLKKKIGAGVFHPFCRPMGAACNLQPIYSSSGLYEACFAEHVHAYVGSNFDVNWCCLSDGRPNFAAGWLLVRRDSFIQFKTSLDIAEDGQLIGHYLAYGRNILYVDIPIAFYNQDHTEPSCSNNWF